MFSEFEMNVPFTEAELQEFVSATDESHFIEYKEALNSNNYETARDIAALAISGGYLIIGVSDGERFLRPVNSKGIVERLDQIIISNIKPKLIYEIREIPSSEENF